MTGRDLILYILRNNLENEPIMKNGRFLKMLTIEEAAIRLNIGVASANALYEEGTMPGAKIGNIIFIPRRYV